jgi:uncharacterized RDD family membrane protein YckC
MADSAPSRLISEEAPFDTVVHVITPERITFEFLIAGPFMRFAAYLIDQVIILLLRLVLSLVAIVATLGSESGIGLSLVIYFLLSWGYGAFCEGIFNGRTIGKRLMMLRVVAEQGVPISVTQAVVRNLLGVVDGPLPFGFLPGLTSMVLSSRFQRLGDLAAGTMVVIEPRPKQREIVRVDEPGIAAVVRQLPLRIAASSEMTRALGDYVRTRNRFGPTRRAEMAEPLAGPLRDRFGLSPEAPADAVLCGVYHRVFMGE